MKKIMVMLLAVVAAINVMADEYTAKAKVTLKSGSGYTCELMLSEKTGDGAVSGIVMNMEDRKVALYAINGDQKLQIVKGADLRNVALGLLTDASTNYTLTVSSVSGSETLYIHDNNGNKDYALTEGASYDFTATASTTDESRFYFRKIIASDLDVCFKNNKLEINYNPFTTTIVIKDADGNQITGSPFAANSSEIDLSSVAAGRYTVEFAGGSRTFIIVKE